MDVHAAEFGAAMQGRDVLAGVEQAARVEGRLDRMEQRQLVGVELRAHLIDLLAADAVLAGDAAAHLHAQLENLAAQVFGAFQLTGLVGIEQDQRVHVAVAGVEHVGHAQSELLGQVGNALEHARQLAARDGAVHAVVIRRDTSNRREGILAPGPEANALGFVLGQAHFGGAGQLEHFADARAVVVHVGFHAIQLAEQDRLGIHRVTGMDEVLGGADRQVVHHLQAAGDDAGGDDVADRTTGLLHRVEGSEQHLGHLRLGQQFDRDFGDDAEHAFGAGEQRQQVEARRVQGVGAERHALAFDGEDVHLEQVMHGQPVFQAVHATGVLGDVAADGTGDLRRGVRCVIQIEGSRGLGDRQVAYTGLDAGEAPSRVDFENLVEARHDQQDALFERQRTA